MKTWSTCVLPFVALIFASPSRADWPRFHGPAGDGIAATAAPTQWSEEENILWKAPLPGAGASSPVIVAGKLFLTASEGSATDVKRHVLCFDAASGKLLWDKTVASDLPEQDRIREDHGYASSTPVATASRLFVFFGKSGVFALDHGGQQLWNTKVGSQLHGWGSAASLTLHGTTVLVNASVESQSLVALDGNTGQERWRAGGINDSWHAPVVGKAPGGREEIILAMLNEVRGFDAMTGAERWRCKTSIPWYMCPLPIVKDGVVYCVGGRSGNGGLAIQLGGGGDVTATHRLWVLDKGTNVPSPVAHDGHLYFVHEGRGTLHCVDLKTGEFVFSEEATESRGAYASLLLAGGKIYSLGRGGKMRIFEAAPELNVLGECTLENGRGMFNASPVADANRLYLRSNRWLYCIGGN
jgi:outer membrane protein assembly factor BamB